MSPPAIDFSKLEGHQSIALMFSGGKDSLALIYLFQEHLRRLTVVHLDAGDLLPEMRELVIKVEKTVPHFHRISTNAPAWMRDNNMLPSSLIAIERHPLLRRGGDKGPYQIPWYDCCLVNKWQPMADYFKTEGFSLLINGQRQTDPVPMSFWQSTDCSYERWNPIVDWTDADVFAYLAGVEAPILPFYRYRTQAPECATCPACWDEKRARYLKQHHPELARRYADYLELQAAAIGPTVRHFLEEREAFRGDSR